MGQYLSSPITDKETLVGSFYGISAHQGWRKGMEDAHIAHRCPNGCYLFGVFDGHGGPEVAQFCSKYMPEELEQNEHFQRGSFAASLAGVFHRMDESLRSSEGQAELEAMRKSATAKESAAGESEDPYDVLRKLMALQRTTGQNGGADGGAEAEAAPAANGASEGTSGAVAPAPEMTVQAGCTAIVALLDGKRLYVANAGDSRAVLCRGTSAVALSQDHKPAQTRERERIVAAGGFLSDIGGICRVNGNLNLSRAIGDLRYKMNTELEPAAQIITAEPDVESVELTPEDRFLVLACDGIWDVMDNQQVVTFVHERLEKGVAPTEICSELLNACLAHDPREARGIGCDNMTAAIILIDDEARKRGAAAAEAASTPTPTLTEKSPTKHMA